MLYKVILDKYKMRRRLRFVCGIMGVMRTFFRWMIRLAGDSASQLALQSPAVGLDNSLFCLRRDSIHPSILISVTDCAPLVPRSRSIQLVRQDSHLHCAHRKRVVLQNRWFSIKSQRIVFVSFDCMLHSWSIECGGEMIMLFNESCGEGCFIMGALFK